jgi:hypothetical protein
MSRRRDGVCAKHRAACVARGSLAHGRSCPYFFVWRVVHSDWRLSTDVRNARHSRIEIPERTATSAFVQVHEAKLGTHATPSGAVQHSRSELRHGRVLSVRRARGACNLCVLRGGAGKRHRWERQLATQRRSHPRAGVKFTRALTRLCSTRILALNHGHRPARRRVPLEAGRWSARRRQHALPTTLACGVSRTRHGIYCCECSQSCTMPPPDMQRHFGAHPRRRLRLREGGGDGRLANATALDLRGFCSVRGCSRAHVHRLCRADPETVEQGHVCDRYRTSITFWDI